MSAQNPDVTVEVLLEQVSRLVTERTTLRSRVEGLIEANTALVEGKRAAEKIAADRLSLLRTVHSGLRAYETIAGGIDGLILAFAFHMHARFHANNGRGFFPDRPWREESLTLKGLAGRVWQAAEKLCSRSGRKNTAAIFEQAVDVANHALTVADQAARAQIMVGDWAIDKELANTSARLLSVMERDASFSEAPKPDINFMKGSVVRKPVIFGHTAGHDGRPGRWAKVESVKPNDQAE